ncbi:NPCBM/NEW2 domain-containing protein [Nonomuraea sediminis]|uniref:NPCBM/NEW2 domain-containing protein n=1 Tax=Nonomuraea sediminis TaxID=2835864 RepID=UPI001BDCF216|nr:NPCBM/NEW2 domain-containing protein [Nonomuraea sediminis]
MRKLLAALTVAVLLVMPLSSANAAPPPVDTPPMGWSSRALGCSVSETSVRQAADNLAPLAQAGYRYVILDGCWQGPDGNADPARFPAGVKALADYVHAKGLKLGLSLSAGTKACAGAGRGSYKHEADDAAMVRGWGVDYVKYDWCAIPTADFPGKGTRDIAQTLYPPMRQALGDSIAFAMNNEEGSTVPWLWGKDVATTWRTNLVTRPIADTYAGMLSVWETTMLRVDHAGKGSWADPDLIQAGLGGMTEAEYRTQLSLWAVAAAPLILQADPAKAPAPIVANPKVVAVDQDKLGAMGRFAQTDGWYHVITKPLENGDLAVVLYNESDRQTTISVKASRLKLPDASRYRVEDLWTGAVWSTKGDLSAAVPGHGSVMYRLSPSREHAAPLVSFDLDPARFLGDNRPSVFEPGKQAEVAATVTNTGGTERLRDVAVTLAVPEGWTATPRTGTTTRGLDAGETFTARWAVTAPAGAEQKAYDLTGTVTAAGGVKLGGAAVARVAQGPGPGRSSISDLTWTKSANYWGPVERDQSVGGKGQNDGLPLTIGGVKYAKGLGTHAPAEIEFYAGGRCSAVEFQGGVDDEVGDAGSVDLEVWADGGRAAHSGILTGAQPAKKVTADVTGARYVRLVVTNGGDNATSDHADFGEAAITCS